MKNKSLAVFFDFDGVVMDTEKYYTHFWNEQGKKYFPEVEQFDQYVKGQALFSIYDKYFKDREDIQHKISTDLAEYEKKMNYRYIDGFVPFISDLKENHVPTALVTSSTNDKMENVYRIYPNFRSYFNIIVTADKITKSKPDPQCYLLAAGECGTKVKNCVVFEDSIKGMESAQNAKMFVIGLSTTFSKEKIKKYVNYVIPDFFSMNYIRLLKIKTGDNS